MTCSTTGSTWSNGRGGRCRRAGSRGGARGDRGRHCCGAGRWRRGLAGRGAVLAALGGSRTSLGVATILAGCVLAYDAGLKRTALGPEVMGACRALNVLLGMSQAPGLGGPVAWLVAGSMGVFVAGVTWI